MEHKSGNYSVHKASNDEFVYSDMIEQTDAEEDKSCNEELVSILTRLKQLRNNEKMEPFVNFFRQKRQQFGLTQEDVAESMRKLYDVKISCSCISAFETFRMSSRRMHKLKPKLERWLKDVKIVHGTPHTPETNLLQSIICWPELHPSIDNTTQQALEKEFRQNPKPTYFEFTLLSESLGIKRQVLKAWFRSRNQKQGRV